MNKNLFNHIDYIDANNENSINMLTLNDYSIMKGITSDKMFGGISYVPIGECPVGYKRNGEECYRVCNHCKYNDKYGIYGLSYLKSDFIRNDFHKKKYTFGGIDGSGYVKLLLL